MKGTEIKFSAVGQRSSQRLVRLCATTAGLALYAGGAFADQPSSTSGDYANTAIPVVTVTAQRRAESIQDVPISITAITGDVLDKNGVRGIGDIFAMTPDVSYVNNGSRDRVDLTIRGISNQLDPYGAVRPQAFAFYVDDFSVAALTANPQVLDMSRVEILRGPQGTYFGRNAEAGAINVATNKPTDDWYEEFGLDYSSFNTVKEKAIVNIPVLPGLFDLRVATQAETSDGNIRNINPTGGGNGYDYETFRVIARVTPNNNLTWDTTLALSHENQGMRDGVPTGALTATWRSVYYHNAQGNIASPDGVGFFPQNTDLVNFNTPQAVGSDYYYVTSKATYNFDDMMFTAVGGYGRSLVYNRGDVDGSSFDFFNERDNISRDTGSGEVRLQSTGDQKLEWNIGANAGRDQGHVNQSTNYGTQNPLGQPAGKQITGNYYYQTDLYAAVFSQATYHLLDQVSVVAGLRYAFEDVHGQFLTLSNQNVSNFEPHRQQNFFSLTPKVTVNYKPTKDLLLYATYSEGYKTGGVQSPSVNIQNDYQPEKLYNYEFGIKLDLFDRRLRLDLAGFHEKWVDVQESEHLLYLNAANALVAVTGIANAGGAASNGADASADLRVTDAIRLHGHLSYDQANYTSFTNAYIDGLTFNATGKPLVDAPKWTAGAMAEYERPVYEDYDGFGQLEWNYLSAALSSSYALRYNYWPFIAPSYNVFNARLGVESNKLRLTVYGENITGAKYFANAYEKAFYSGVQVVPSYRRIGVNMDYKF